MKTLISLLALFLSLSIYSQSSSFCNGFKKGYKAGYCYDDAYGCVTPVFPPCPVPNIGNNSYQGGYNQGFVAGQKAKGGEEDYNQIAIEAESEAREAELEAFNRSMEYASKAFGREDYEDCIWYYEQTKQYGFYDNRFDFAVGVSHYVLWQKTGKSEHKRQAIAMLELAIKHGNQDAKRVLKEIKGM